MKIWKIRILEICRIQCHEEGTLQISQMRLNCNRSYLVKRKVLVRMCHFYMNFLSNVLETLGILYRFLFFQNSHRHFLIYNYFLMCWTLYFWSFLYNNYILLSSKIHFKYLNLKNPFISMNFFISYSVINNNWSNSIFNIIESFFCNQNYYRLTIYMN